MNRLIIEFLAIMLALLCSIAAIVEAQDLDKNQALGKDEASRAASLWDEVLKSRKAKN